MQVTRDSKRERRPFVGSSLALAAGLVLTAGPVTQAAECGDDVRGARVACACGDVVVSDTVLKASDPVVRGRCPLDGLIVRAPSAATDLTLDLGGHALVGSGDGYGLRIDAGGTDGARIIGGPGDARGEIVAFAVGILAPSAKVLSRIERVDVKGNRRDGLHLRTAGALLIDVSANDNGGDGIRMRGQGGRLQGIEASGNREVGVRLQSRGTIVSGRTAFNGRHGVLSEGARNDLTAIESRDNGGAGVIARGRAQRTEGLIAEGNALGNLRLAGPEPTR